MNGRVLQMQTSIQSITDGSCFSEGAFSLRSLTHVTVTYVNARRRS